MITQCVSAICTLAIIVLAILIMTRAISLDNALKAAGRVLAMIFLIYVAVCALAAPLRTGVAALASLLASAIRWLVVAVIVVGLLILVTRVLLERLSGRSGSEGGRD